MNLDFPGGSAVKNSPAMQKMWVRSLDQEDPLEQEMATYSSILAWESPWTEKPGGLQSQFSCTVMSDSLQSPWTAVHQASLSITNSHSLLKLMPLSWWWNPTISSSVIPYFFCLQSFPASRSFQVSQFFPSGGQSIKFQFQHQSFQWIFRTDFL